jgi:hypothetical protein
MLPSGSDAVALSEIGAEPSREAFAVGEVRETMGGTFAEVVKEISLEGRLWRPAEL